MDACPSSAPSRRRQGTAVNLQQARERTGAASRNRIGIPIGLRSHHRRFVLIWNAAMIRTPSVAPIIPPMIRPQSKVHDMMDAPRALRTESGISA